MNLKFEMIVQNFRKIIQLNAVIILKSTNEYYQNFFSKLSLKMDLYPAMDCGSLDKHEYVILLIHEGLPFRYSKIYFLF